MRLAELPGLEAEQLTQLQAAGIGNCQQLLRATKRQDRLLTLARAADLSPEALRSVVHRAELSQIRGVGPTTLAHLFAVGVDSLAALTSQGPEALQAQLHRRIARPPNLAVIEDWILQARRLSGHRSELVAPANL
jgi:nucleotidyltransferase/DNA polymerase involved in DNA repair